MGMADSGEQYIVKASRFDKSAIQLISTLDSPYIAKIIELNDNEIYMEYVDGEILSNKNTPTDIYQFFTELCDAVSALHSVGVIHRDIKPSNIMLTSDGNIKLIDFDAARVKKINQDKDTSFIGTDGFAPPEQYGFEQTDERSDIYALGVTMKLILNDDFDKSPYRPIIEKCLKFSPDQRYSSACELKKALAFCKNRNIIMLSAISAVAVAGIVSACLLISGKPAVDTPENPVSDAQITTTPVTTETSTAPVFSEEMVDEGLLYWELLPVPEGLPKLYDYVSEYSYDFGYLDFYWEEMSAEDYNNICKLIQGWLGDFNTFEPREGLMYQNSDYTVSIDYYEIKDINSNYQLSIRLMPENDALPVIPAAPEYSIPADSIREVSWPKISSIPENFPALTDSVTAYEDGKIYWDRMSKEELCNIALKIADTCPLTSVNISETDIIYNFEGDSFRTMLHRTNFISELKPHQVTLQIVY